MKKILILLVVVSALIFAFFQVPENKLEMYMFFADYQMKNENVEKASDNFDKVLSLFDDDEVRLRIGRLCNEYQEYELAVSYLDQKEYGLISNTEYWKLLIELKLKLNSPLDEIGQLYVRASNATHNEYFKDFVTRNTPEEPILSSESGYYLNAMYVTVSNYNEEYDYEVHVNNSKENIHKIPVFKKMQGIVVNVKNKYGFTSENTFSFLIKNGADFILDATFVDEDQNTVVINEEVAKLDGYKLIDGLQRTSISLKVEGSGSSYFYLDYSRLPKELAGLSKYTVTGISKAFKEEHIMNALSKPREGEGFQEIKNIFGATYYYRTLIGFYDSKGKLLAYQIFEED